MYTKLLQGQRSAGAGAGAIRRTPTRPAEVLCRVESYELTEAELRVMLRGGRK